MKSIFLLFFFSLIINLPCFSQSEFNFGASGGVYYNNTLANVQIHAYKNSDLLGYSDPIKVHNRLIGLNFEYRNKLLDKLAIVSSFNLQRSEFSGGGKDSLGFDEKMSFKFKYSYFQLMGFEFLMDNDNHQLDIGLSVDLGLWRLKRQYINAAAPNAEYLKSYGSYQLGYTCWLRYSLKSLEDLHLVLSWHRAVISSYASTYNSATLTVETPYEYRLKFLSFGIRYSINAN